MNDHIIANAKAYAALLGAMVTAILPMVPMDTTLHVVLVTVSVLATAIVTWKIPLAASYQANLRRKEGK